MQVTDSTDLQLPLVVALLLPAVADFSKKKNHHQADRDLGFFFQLMIQ